MPSETVAWSIYALPLLLRCGHGRALNFWVLMVAQAESRRQEPAGGSRSFLPFESVSFTVFPAPAWYCCDRPFWYAGKVVNCMFLAYCASERIPPPWFCISLSTASVHPCLCRRNARDAKDERAHLLPTWADGQVAMNEMQKVEETRRVRERRNVVKCSAAQFQWYHREAAVCSP